MSVHYVISKGIKKKIAGDCLSFAFDFKLNPPSLFMIFTQNTRDEYISVRFLCYKSSYLCLVVTSVTSYFRSCNCKRFFQHVCSFYNPYTPTISRACYPSKPSLGYARCPLPQNWTILSWQILRCSQEYLWRDRFLHLYYILYVVCPFELPILFSSSFR